MKRSRLAAMFAASACSLALLSAVALAQNQLPDGSTQIGKARYGGPKPTTSAGTLADGATDMQGTVTATAVTTFTITFTSTWTTVPKCFLNNQTGTRAGQTAAPTATTLVVAGVTAGDVVDYWCVGRLN